MAWKTLTKQHDIHCPSAWRCGSVSVQCREDLAGPGDHLRPVCLSESWGWGLVAWLFMVPVLSSSVSWMTSVLSSSRLGLGVSSFTSSSSLINHRIENG